MQDQPQPIDPTVEQQTDEALIAIRDALIAARVRPHVAVGACLVAAQLVAFGLGDEAAWADLFESGARQLRDVAAHRAAAPLQ